MGAFRGDDETLEKEIVALEGIVRVRLKRVSAEMNDLDRDLKALKAERARRRARADATASGRADATATA